MSFANLLKNAPPGGKIKLKGGQSQGHVAKGSENICVNKYTPSLGKGSEYAAKFRLEDEKAYNESIMSSKPGLVRTDVTSGEGPSQMFQPEELTSIGTVPNLHELNSEDLTQVYQNYAFDAVEPSQQLEHIFDEREQILRLIESNQVCIIKGPTGCGKSTQIPQFILDSYVKRRAHCNIVVTQPRRIAAITIAQHVCKERKWDVGSIVGYQVALDKKMSTDTRLTYCTTGVLLEKLINTKSLNDYTHILLDEVHERDVDMDLTMLIVKLFLRKNSPNVKVVLMSATMDVTRFAKYYEVVLRDERQPAPYYEIQRQSTFTVQVHYLDALKNLGILPDRSEKEPQIAKETYNLIPMMIRAFNSIDEEDFKRKRSLDEKGAVLIFLPGLYQIEILYEILQNEDKKDPSSFNLWICPLHSSITKDEQEKVRHYAPPGKRKVILSTNIAESSITIPDVKFVIDFCLTKHLVADQETGFTSLQLAWASHTNCTQREGRAGRVQDGRVYRMVYKSFYMLSMSKECVAEMQRCPLQIVVLKCKKMMEEECPLRLISNALDPPDLSNYENTILKLKEVGALLTTCRGVNTPHDGDLTFFGKVMASLPLDIHITKLILLGHIFDVLEETIIMGCAMSVRNIFSEPFQKRLEAYNNKLLWADSSESDLIAYLNAYMVWRQLTGMGKFNRSGTSEATWARRYMLQLKHLQEVAKQEDDIKRRLKSLNIKVVRQRNKPIWLPQEKPLILKLVLAGAFYPHYYVRSAQNPNAESDAVKSLAGHSPFNSVYVQNMPHPAPLYIDQLRDCLKQNGISEDLTFFYDDSRKLIVSFNPGKTSAGHMVGEKNLNMNIPGEIVMPVYRAIKMRQLNIPIKIKTYPSSMIKEKLNMLSLHSRNSMRSQNSLDYRPKIPLHTEVIEIDVVFVDNASHFYAHVHPIRSQLQQIHSILSKPGSLVELSGDVVDGFTYAAPYRDREDEDFFNYRAHVKKKYHLQEVLWVDVLFIDYGNTGRMPAHELRELASEEMQQELDEIPALALECTLAEVAPSVWSNQGAMWSEAANKYVTTILNKRNCWYAKVYSYIEDVASLRLYLEDNYEPSLTEPKTLNDELINKGYGRYREESYFSKMNHAKREEIQQRSDRIEESSDTSSTVSSSFKEVDLMALPTTNSRSLVELKGPNSPLEMKLFSMAHCSTRKEVKVDGSSVNSVLLDSDPTDPHDRLLVAGSVSQTSDGRKLLLNHTTVLPNMHGLAALVCLLFAPVVEYRSDDCYSRYTGALCGLGMKENGVPLFPANDMEVKFDVEFTEDDLTSVNKLRYWINCRFSGNSDPEDFPDHELIECQKNIRAFAISLLKRTRRTVRVYPNLYQFQWGRVPEIRLLNPYPEESDVNDSISIYKLHKGIELHPNNDRKDVELMVYKLVKLREEILSGLTPKVLRCELCDVDFEYCNMLRLHMTSSYHMQLKDWLKSRADAHNIPLPKNAQAKF